MRNSEGMARLALVLLLLLAACGPTPPPPAGLQVEPPPPVSGPPDPRTLKAVEDARAGRSQQALDAALQFTRDEPGNAEAWALLAVLQRAMGHLDEAARSAEKAAKLDRGYTALVVQAGARGDAGEALAAARRLAAEDPGNAAARQALAEALLYDASVRLLESGPDPKEAARAAAEARTEASAALRRAGRTPIRAEALATIGNSWFLEGDLAKAAAHYRQALEAGLPPGRAVDVAHTLAWLSFREGDRPGCARWLHRALELVQEGPLDESALIPRWEYLQMELWAFAGEKVDSARLAAREPVYERLRGMGLVDHFEYRTTRAMLREVMRLREAGQHHEAIKVLYDDPYGDDLDRLEEEGELRPRSFVSEAVERDAEETLFHALRAELAREAGDTNAAHHWYQEALGLAPGNAILQERIRTLP